MNRAEKRQARRIIRNARAAESHLFQLIDELQEAKQNANAEHDWQETIDHVHQIQSYLPLITDMARNIQRETMNTVLVGEGGAQ